jgi:hypothetical protein
MSKKLIEPPSFLGAHAFASSEPINAKYRGADGAVYEVFPGDEPGPSSGGSLVSVYKNTETEYVLKITQADGTFFLTPNLRPPVIRYGFY